MISFLYVALLASMPQAEAKLGEPVSDFILKHKELKLKGSSNQHGATNYNFSLEIDESERQAAPGFGAGLTVTVKSGKISGQSMAVCIGKEQFMGTQLAGAYGLKFACEAIGRTIPGDKTAQDRELEVFNRSASDALLGMPKEITYKGFDPKIILSRSPDGNLLIAVSKREPAPTAAAPANAVTPPVVPGKTPAQTPAAKTTTAKTPAKKPAETAKQVDVPQQTQPQNLPAQATPPPYPYQQPYGYPPVQQPPYGYQQYPPYPYQQPYYQQPPYGYQQQQPPVQYPPQAPVQMPPQQPPAQPPQ